MADVLIVDDEPDSVEVVVKYLERLGHRVRTQPNGREALFALTSAPPDVVVLDLRMPEMDGVSFMHVLRSYLQWQHIPVIILTALSNGPEQRLAQQYGIVKVFRKAGVDFGELAACIDEATGAQTTS